MISFIHVGKCGGSTLGFMFKKKFKFYKEYHHHKNYKKNEKYIIWLRNPLSRFVSAFNMSKSIISFKFNKYTKANRNNCICPFLIYRALKRNTKYIFSNNYDTLIKKFKSANNLAESLSSNDMTIKENAIKLMNSHNGHIFKGIGWYLNNGLFVKRKNKKILFVGKLETMSDDIKLLEFKLKRKFIKIPHIRKNKENYSKYLSPLAINNLINFYKDTDYAALNELYNYKWIDKKTLDSYYLYTKE